MFTRLCLLICIQVCLFNLDAKLENKTSENARNTSMVDHVRQLLSEEKYQEVLTYLKNKNYQDQPKILGYLGTMYAQGNGVEIDNKKALYYFEQSASKGDVDSQVILAGFYFEGLGTKKDFKKGLFWIHKAEAQEAEGAYHILAIAYDNGNGVVKNEKKAFEYYEKGALLGDLSCQHQLGDRYIQGKGCNKDLKEAFKWYEKAAQAGDAEGQLDLAIMYYKGEGMAQDYELAIFWLEKAADQNNGKAQYMLGKMYQLGLGSVKDANKARQLFLAAAENNFPQAIQELNEENPTINYKIERKFNARSDKERYYIKLTTKNLPLDVPLKLEAEQNNKAASFFDIIINKQGRVLKAKDSNPLFIPVLNIEKVESLKYQIKSIDDQILAAITIPFQLIAKDSNGHVLLLKRDYSTNETFGMKASGFEPFEKVEFISSSGNEVMNHPIKMSEKGEIQTLLSPATIGHRSGKASVQLKGKTTENLIINYTWGNE